MSWRGGRIPYRGGCGNVNCGGRVRGQGQNYSGKISEAKKLLCNDIGTSVLDYGQKSASDQTRSSWDKLAQYVGMNYGQDISNGLQNKIIVNLVEPVHAPEVIARHSIWERIIRTGQSNIHTDRATQRTILEASVTAVIDDAATMKLVVLDNNIAQGDYEENMDVPIIMTDSEKN